MTHEHPTVAKNLMCRQLTNQPTSNLRTSDKDKMIADESK